MVLWAWATLVFAQEPATVALRWTQVPDASVYELQIAEDPQFRSLKLETRLQVAGYRWAHLPRQRYFWRVRSVDAQGRLGDWSAVRTIEPAVAAPTVLQPKANAAIAVDQPLLVEVAPSEVIREHVIELAADRGFQTAVRRERFQGPRATLPASLLSVGSLYLRVRGVDLSGRDTAWSTPLTVRVLHAAPRLLLPADDETLPWGDPPPAVTLQWAEVEGADGYQLAISEAGRPERLTQVKGTVHRLAPKKPGAWQWRVRAVAAGSEGVWSPRRTLLLTLPAPELVAPSDGRRFETRTGEAEVALRWRRVPLVTRYEVQLSRSAAFAREETRTETVSADEWSGRLPLGAWYARIAATRNGVASTSSPRFFEIVARPPLVAPAPLAPAEGETLSRGDVVLRWEPVEGAHHYDVALATGDAAAELNSAVPSLALATDADGACRFRVRGVDDEGAPGPWSDWRAFEIGIPPAVRAELSVAQDTLRADGASATALQVRLIDAAGRPIRGAAPELIASAGTVSPLREQDGVYTATFVAPAEPPPDEVVSLRVRHRDFERSTRLRVLPSNPRWLFGAEVGWNLTLGALSSPFLGLTADLPLPGLDRRLWVLARIGGYFGGRELQLGAVRVEADAQVGRASVLAALRFPWRGLELGGGLGPSLQLVRARVGAQRTVAAAAGLQLLVSGQYRLGPGVAGVELSYSFGEVVTPEVRLRTGGATATVGYRVGFR